MCNQLAWTLSLVTVILNLRASHVNEFNSNSPPIGFYSAVRLVGSRLISARINYALASVALRKKISTRRLIGSAHFLPWNLRRRVLSATRTQFSHEMNEMGALIDSVFAAKFGENFRNTNFYKNWKFSFEKSYKLRFSASYELFKKYLDYHLKSFGVRSSVSASLLLLSSILAIFLFPKRFLTSWN